MVSPPSRTKERDVMNTMTIMIGDVEHEVPADWEICVKCGGEGKHSLAIDGHGISEYEREMEWSEEEWELYLNGGYDSPCEDCYGTGKVRTPNVDFLEPELLKQYRKEEDERMAFEIERECERRYGC